MRLLRWSERLVTIFTHLMLIFLGLAVISYIVLTIVDAVAGTAIGPQIPPGCGGSKAPWC